jgi:hypothetical protein
MYHVQWCVTLIIPGPNEDNVIQCFMNEFSVDSLFRCLLAFIGLLDDLTTALSLEIKSKSIFYSIHISTHNRISYIGGKSPPPPMNGQRQNVFCLFFVDDDLEIKSKTRENHLPSSMSS